MKESVEICRQDYATNGPHTWAKSSRGGRPRLTRCHGAGSPQPCVSALPAMMKNSSPVPEPLAWWRAGQTIQQSTRATVRTLSVFTSLASALVFCDAHPVRASLHHHDARLCPRPPPLLRTCSTKLLAFACSYCSCHPPPPSPPPARLLLSSFVWAFHPRSGCDMKTWH